MAAPQSLKREREQSSRLLRAQGRSWVEIAHVFRERYRVNARLAFRLAHGWSQREVADRWNARWPDELKTFKNISSWELWPGGTGHAPSFDSLDKLAQLYRCRVSDLLADLSDHRGDDAHRHPASGGPAAPAPLRRADVRPGLAPAPVGLLGLPVPVLPPGALAGITSTTGRESLTDRLGAVLADPAALVECVANGLSWQLGQATYDQLTGWLRSWADAMDRREFLRALGWAATAAAAASPLEGSPLEGSPPDERARVLRAVAGTHRVDARVIDTVEDVLSAARRQDDALGPQAALDTVLAQRSLARRLLTECPQRLRARLLGLYGLLSASAGWLYFDLGAFERAWPHYQAAREAAREADRPDLDAWALSGLSWMARDRGERQTALDLAAAAGRRAAETADLRLRACLEGRAAGVHAMVGQAEPCLRALGRAEGHLSRSEHDVAPDSLVYFYGTEMLTYQMNACHLLLGRPQGLDTARQALIATEGVFTRDLGLTKLKLGRAYVAAGEPDEAATVTAEVTDLTMRNHSPRLARELRATRAALEPWSRRPAVRDLDDRLAACGLG